MRRDDHAPRTSGQGAATELLGARLSPDAAAEDRSASKPTRGSSACASSTTTAGRCGSGFTYRGDSLWWFTELYLHKMRVLERALETVLALEAAVAPTRPATHRRRERRPDRRAAAQRVRPPRGDSGRASKARATRPAAHDRFTGFARRRPRPSLSRLRRAERPAPARRARRGLCPLGVLAGRARRTSGGRESYIGPVLDAVARSVGPGRTRVQSASDRAGTSARRRWWDPVVARHEPPSVTPIEHLAPRARARARPLALWRNRARRWLERHRRGPRDSRGGRWRDYDLWPVLSDRARRAAPTCSGPGRRGRWTKPAPRSTRLSPEVVVTYAEAGGWGRALMLEARRAGVPSVGLQHGFIYRHWLNYQHEADEMAADGHGRRASRGPIARCVFDRFAARTLEAAGPFPAGALAVTGSPRLDELVAARGGHVRRPRRAARALSASAPATRG